MLQRIIYDIDKDLFLQDFLINESLLTFYEDERVKNDHWSILRDHDSSTDVLRNFSDLKTKQLGIPVKARYYKLKANTQLIWHTDLGTKCAINYILNENSSSVLFGDWKDYQEFTYDAALLDVSKSHSVINNNTDRILLKLSIIDHTYDEVYEKLSALNLIQCTGHQ